VQTFFFPDFESARAEGFKKSLFERIPAKQFSFAKIV